MVMPSLRLRSCKVLYNRFEFSRIPERMFNHLVACAEHVPSSLATLLLRKVYASVPGSPPSLLRELDHRALAIEEEEVLRVRNGNTWIGLLATRRDLGADRVNQHLGRLVISFRSSDDGIHRLSVPPGCSLPPRTLQTPRLVAVSSSSRPRHDRSCPP